MYGAKFWYGKEVEGRLKGILTCYIREEIPDDALEYPHVYFTIEFCRNAENYNQIRKLIDISNSLFTIEATQDSFKDIPIWLFNSVHIIYRIPDENIQLLKLSDTISIDAGWYRTLQMQKECMIESKPENYQFDTKKSLNVIV